MIHFVFFSIYITNFIIAQSTNFSTASVNKGEKVDHKMRVGATNMWKSYGKFPHFVESDNVSTNSVEKWEKRNREVKTE